MPKKTTKRETIVLDSKLLAKGEIVLHFVPEPEAKKVNKRVKRQDPDKAKRAKGKRKPPRELKVPAKKKGKK